jgi:hypothetical protein
VGSLNKQIYRIHILGIKRAESDPLSIRFPVAQRPFLKLNDSDQELFAIVGSDDFSVRVEPSKSTRP